MAGIGFKKKSALKVSSERIKLLMLATVPSTRLEIRFNETVSISTESCTKFRLVKLNPSCYISSSDDQIQIFPGWPSDSAVVTVLTFAEPDRGIFKIMKLLKKENINWLPVLSVERNFLLFRTVTKYEGHPEIPGYWDWLKLPNRTKIYNGPLEFQLNSWAKLN